VKRYFYVNMKKQELKDMIGCTTPMKCTYFNLFITTLDQIFTLKVNPTMVYYEPLNNCANAYSENFSRLELPSDSRKRASYT